MKKIKKEEIIGWSGSAIIVLLMLFLLTHLFLRAETPPEENDVMMLPGGVLINQGAVDWSGGTFTPRDNVPGPEDPAPPLTTSDTNTEEIPSVITDNTENTAAIQAERERKEKEERERKEKERLEAERRRQQEINNRMSNAFGAGNTGGGSGTGSGSGSDPGSGRGSGGGTGTSAGGAGYGDFDLGGRGLYPGSALPKPAYTVQEEGTIVVEVTVNPQGNVILAQVRAKGTNITNESMRNSAVGAARKARFAVINGSDNQTGTITYRYKLN